MKVIIIVLVCLLIFSSSGAGGWWYYHNKKKEEDAAKQVVSPNLGRRVPPPLTGDTTLVSSGDTTLHGTYTASASSASFGTSAYWPFTTDKYLWHSDINVYDTTTVGGMGNYKGTNATTTAAGMHIEGEWIQIKLPITFKFSSYTIKPRPDSNLWHTRSPRAFHVLGSNTGDDKSWVVIDSRVNIQDWSIQAKKFTLGTPMTTGYAYFRIVVSEVGNTKDSPDNNSVQIHTLYFDE